MIKRILEEKIKSKIGRGKAILIFGARQLGKTTLLKHIFSNSPDTLWLNGDEPDVQALFQNVNSAQLRSLFSGKKSARTGIHHFQVGVFQSKPAQRTEQQPKDILL